MVAVIGLLIVIVVVLGIAWALSRDQLPPDAAEQRATVSLRAIHRRLEVAQCKSEMQADAARLRRELRKALEKQEQP